MLTCYDYPSACLVAQTDLDCVLVGDSVAMTVHGHANTLAATIDMLALHTAAVARGTQKQFIVSDLPFLSYRASIDKTIEHVKDLMQAGAHAIKLEGADEHACQTISHLVASGVPVMGHIGLTPQSIHQLGGYRIQGQNHAEAKELLQQAKYLEKAGCFALVIECIPQWLAKEMTSFLDIPTIGIGAGADTDGQILVWQDMLALQTEFKPRFVKHYCQGKDVLKAAIDTYIHEVSTADFPSKEYSY